MRLWRRSPPVDRADAEVTEAARARMRAEKGLKNARRDLEETRRQTPAHKALGESLRVLREDNHIRKAFHDTILRGRS